MSSNKNFFLYFEDECLSADRPSSLVDWKRVDVSLGTWVLCMSCQRVYKIGEFRSVPIVYRRKNVTLYKCPYDDCLAPYGWSSVWSDYVQDILVLSEILDPLRGHVFFRFSEVLANWIYVPYERDVLHS